MKLKSMIMLGAAIALAGCASTTRQSQTTPLNNVAHIQTPALTEGHNIIYFIRGKNAITGPAVNIFVDGHFVTSLLPGKHRALSICSHITNISAAFTNPNANYRKLRQVKHPFEFKEGNIYYLSIEPDTNNHPNLVQLTEQEGQNVLKYTDESIRTLPRLPDTNCIQDAPLPVIKKYTISTNALFAFSKADRQHLLNEGKKELERIAQEIKKDESQIGFIAVLGHTDPIGSDEFNNRLSQQRAETVRSLLIDSGLSKKDILAEGRGKTELLVKDCAQRFANNTSALTQCNLPNRRVEVITYGLRVQ